LVLERALDFMKVQQAIKYQAEELKQDVALLTKLCGLL
jgi:hypothetical protein